MKTVCIIQARTTSSRLPNKVMLSLPFGSETTVLEQVVNRVRRSKRIDQVVIATTVNPTDQPIVDLCEVLNIPCYRGSEENVLSRYYESAKVMNATTVVRVTSDCPCIDPSIIDIVIDQHFSQRNDYTSNNRLQTFPHGLDVEVFSFKALEMAYNRSTEKIEIEHVTPFIYKTHANEFQIGNVENQKHTHSLRVTLDTPNDYTLLCALFDMLPNNFGINEIEDLFASKPWLKNINNEVDNKVVCSTLEEELLEAKRLLKKQDLLRALDLLEQV